MTRDDRLRIAVFIDFDNIEIGVKNTLGASFDAGLVLEALRERGDVVSKTAYSDWQRAGNYSRMLTQHAIKMVQRNPTPGGDKNGADINLALDALEMAFTHQHINAFVIVGGDSDFISLVEKLKQYDKKIFVVGGRQFTSIIMQRNCHEFIAYENLVGTTAAPAAGGGRGRGHGRPTVRVERTPIEQVVPLVTRALQVLSEREVAPQMGLLKTTLLQLDSTFSERDYGAGSFRDFVQKLEKIGVVTVQQAKGGLLVGPGDAALAPSEPSAEPVTDEGDARVSAESDASAPAGSAPAFAPAPRDWRGGRTGGSGTAAQATPAPPVTGTNADGVIEFTRILATGQVRRWPMYLRNVKQVLRQVNPDFDERAYGFANLVDLLRAAGREGLVRVDRDRQGVIRVFQGSASVVPVAVAAALAPHGDELPEFVPAADLVRSRDADEDFSGQPAVVAQPHLVDQHDDDPDDSIGNRLAPGEVREIVVPRPGVTKRPASSRRPATAPRKRAAVTPARESSRHEGASKRAPRARKARR